ncbi:putative RNA-binding Zn ribbon-like protein [Diaminobutyricimonas aerilata]|uniref:Putative RNA-binding Zn ribbon-like protein n=1 Tax=Diaminobutyricimonas aerilata TaxID=1162967 RepID=A0A2M9CLY0_9MICO|nr:CGNR zinc finger domain-containing protein [Diaminobutyricimonas aerilata]PJJ72896.1 putative RNA-binding Zn ribbon-like protein [Diaminobutyricimonas aerilata]
MGSLDHVANDVALEFANSVNERPHPRVDWFADARSAATWTESMGWTAGQLDDAGLDALRELRETIHRIARAFLDGTVPASGDLAALARAHATGLRVIGVQATDGRLHRAWPEIESGASLAARAASAAMALFESERLTRLRACPSCGWLFVDVSRNGGRRWCSMEMCGARSKARAYYRRGHGD